MTSYALVLGLFQIFQKSDNTSKCRLAEIGSSPSRKYKGIIGEHLLSFNMARRTLCWKVSNVFITVGLIGRAAKPDLRIGLINVAQV